MKNRGLPKGSIKSKSILSILWIIPFTVWPCFALAPRSCVGSTLPVGSFHLLLESSSSGPPLPVRSINMIEPGQKLKYEPVHFPAQITDKSRIAVVLVPAPGAKDKHLEVLDARPAKADAEWAVPMRASVVGVVFGPHGLDIKKFSLLVKKNPELISELANYAQQSSTVNALVQTLSKYETSRPGSEDLNAALTGFSSRYGVLLPRVDSTNPTNEQASQLLQAVLPSLSSHDPLATGSAGALEQSAGLAASVASLFYGTPVGLAAGGAALFQNLRTMIFPNTDFRAAFTQSEGANGMELCSPKNPPKPRTRIAYLWMLRVPDAAAPSVSGPETQTLPLGWSSLLRVTCATHDQLRLLPRARQWQLVSSSQQETIPVKVIVGPAEDTLALNLSQAKLPAGQYHLAALWDWKPFKVAGTVNLRPFSNFDDVKVAPQSEDRLVEGRGPVKIKLTGADFEFVNKVAIAEAGQLTATARELPFTIPGTGEQLHMEAEVDTALLQPRDYLLLLTQMNGKTQKVPITVHPPHPKIDNLPLRANLGQRDQDILLRGTGLERIQEITSKDASWVLAPLPADSHDVTERKVTLKLHPGLQKGALLDASMTVTGINEPVELANVLQVAGPLPRIASVRESLPAEGTVALRSGEIPASSAVSFALRTENVDSQPSLQLACGGAGSSNQDLELQPGERTDAAQLDYYAGENTLFLSIIPGKVGQSGCVLTATVSTEDAGVSGPYTLGRVIRLPRIGKFWLSNESLGRSLYAGTLTGQDLQMIAETGWNAKIGFPVQGIPTPLPGSPLEQTLRIEMPWPPPAPGAPVYVWLRGETQGRRTNARY